MTDTVTQPSTQDLAALDHAHVWHPFTPMQQWREQIPIIVERGEGDLLIDTDGQAYIDGVSSLWCNVHGHRVPEVDQAIRDQLDKIAHTTQLGLASPPAIQLAKMLVDVAPGGPKSAFQADGPPERLLNKVFYSDAGATAVEVAFKMAVGYWFHVGRPEKQRFIGLAGAYHGDTTGTMSVGFSELFHKPFVSMVFDISQFPSPDPCRLPSDLPRVGRGCDASEGMWPSEDPALQQALTTYCLENLEERLKEEADKTAAIVIEPIMQGAAGMICQPPGFLRGVADLAKKYDVLLIADEVAVGFGRTGALFACEHEQVVPDILCLAKGITAGYLPLAATLCTDTIEQAFCGSLDQKKTLYHGHTYTGNPLAAAASIASLQKFEDDGLIAKINDDADFIREALHPLRESDHVHDIRQRGTMVGIELCASRSAAGGPQPFNFAARTGYAVCDAVRQPRDGEPGLIIRPLGDVLVLMPPPGIERRHLELMVNRVVQTIRDWSI